MPISRRIFLKKAALGIFAATAAPQILYAKNSTGSFIDKLLPAPIGGGFEMPDYWVWGSSVIKGEDGKYHMFADRWKKDIGFQGWVTNSQVVHAIADKPEGPYLFSDVSLPIRGAEYFDGLVTHNPRVIYFKGTYYLYYFGTTYDFPVPQAGTEWQNDWFERAWMNKRIGVAWSKSLYGPWHRPERPAIEPRPGKWDATITTNPSPVINPITGKILLMYKSSPVNSAPPLLLGVAEADHPLGEYKRLSDEPIFRFDTAANQDNDVEDPFVWHNGEFYELIMKDRFGHICGEEGGGIHATSKDGIDWKLSNPVKAYSRTVRWNDGSVTHQANFERPFLLIENGKPTHLFAATGAGSSPWNFERTWNMVIPLK
ncbi:glycoside hydrolase family protein [Dysgonomonas sp. Marseille-P4677]|uniref:glycoside hydrolase family protein n=1 Tax=Dysgonomonas sp. Marseille-P4677 TaxID=2364790 RepID=UPI001911790C|nr:glycoside hydrolase family protein [Dysgonomonas sp. Marseille-P4677]MBK5719912.1 glycoside hydrolase family protein [Dysgonomonas sp. Marseille-P4677]